MNMIITGATAAFTCLASIFADMAFADDFHMGEISSIEEQDAGNGNIAVDVTYIQSCQDQFVNVVVDVTSSSPSATNVVVGVLLERDSDLQCLAEPTEETVSFEIGNIAGEYSFHPIEP